MARKYRDPHRPLPPWVPYVILGVLAVAAGVAVFMAASMFGVQSR